MKKISLPMHNKSNYYTEFQKKKRINLAKTVDIVNKKQASNHRLKRIQKEIEFMKDFDSKYWDRVDAGRRGALNVVNN